VTYSCMHHDPVPSARVVREAGATVAEPRRPLDEHLMRAFSPIARHGRDALEVLIGLWPLTAIMAVAFALLWAAGTSGSP
jgi:hypothetical protein